MGAQKWNTVLGMHLAAINRNSTSNGLNKWPYIIFLNSNKSGGRQLLVQWLNRIEMGIFSWAFFMIVLNDLKVLLSLDHLLTSLADNSLRLHIYARDRCQSYLPSLIKQSRNFPNNHL